MSLLRNVDFLLLSVDNISRHQFLTVMDADQMVKGALTDEGHAKSLLTSSEKREIIESSEEDLSAACAILKEIEELSAFIDASKLDGMRGLCICFVFFFSNILVLFQAFKLTKMPCSDSNPCFLSKKRQSQGLPSVLMLWFLVTMRT